MDFVLSNINKEGISLIEIYPAGTVGKMPMVILFHGYLGQKEFVMAQAYNLARHGFFVVFPDAYNHGERNSGQTPDFIESVLKTTEEINTLIDCYENDDRVDISRVGIAGYSMGGCIVFNYLAGDDKRVKAAVPVIATPDWISIISIDMVQVRLKSIGIAKSDAEMEEYIRMAERLQPLNRFSAMKDIPMLILNGDVDPIIPIENVREFYKQLRELYTRKEDIKLIEYKETGHTDTIQMNMELAGWFKKYLKP
ncbi:MAG TPA: alpha/beta fold hydrolase [Clostridiaceae bacterium]|nr:alpha/beta fold hydrolase [Clostridiaceae bacterium]